MENLSCQKQKVDWLELYYNPEILLLDEATSSLDKELRKAFEYLNSIKNMIIISIFHEDSFMKFVG